MSEKRKIERKNNKDINKKLQFTGNKKFQENIYVNLTKPIKF